MWRPDSGTSSYSIYASSSASVQITLLEGSILEFDIPADEGEDWDYINVGQGSFYDSYESSIEWTAPTVPGYHFDGWYTIDKDYSTAIGVVPKSLYTTKISGDATVSWETLKQNGKSERWNSSPAPAQYNNHLRLIYTPSTYTIRFNANGGTGTMSDLGMTYGTAKNLTANAFTRTGYTFAGWNTESDGSGTSYADKQSVNNLSGNDGAVVTLYAKWTANQPVQPHAQARRTCHENLLQDKRRVELDCDNDRYDALRQLWFDMVRLRRDAGGVYGLSAQRQSLRGDDGRGSERGCVHRIRQFLHGDAESAERKRRNVVGNGDLRLGNAQCDDADADGLHVQWVLDEP